MIVNHQYIIVLGVKPALSLAEIYSVFASLGFSMRYLAGSREIAVIETLLSSEKVLAAAHHLGGTIKIAHVLFTKATFSPEHVAAVLPPTDEKIFFGISLYPHLPYAPQAKLRANGPSDVRGEGNSRRNRQGGEAHSSRAPFFDKKLTERVGVAVKKMLQAQGTPSRFVTSRESTLSSVVVHTNKLLSARGAEVVVAATGDTGYVYGKTIYAQPYDLFALRDAGRPLRDAHAGMIPPKLARMMVNFTRHDGGGVASILDPFCGSGTILQEALLAGIPHLYGSDADQHAAMRTRKNLAWLPTQKPWKTLSLSGTDIRVGDARRVHEVFDGIHVDAVATEPYLGAPQTTRIKNAAILSLQRELSPLYFEAGESCARILNRKGRMVMVWPFWEMEDGRFAFIELEKEFRKIGLRAISPLPPHLQSLFDREQGYDAVRHSLLYHRARQIVMREIRVFEKD